MKTRSQSLCELKNKKKKEFVVDFDAASKAWQQNKIRMGNGTYKYKSSKTVDTHSYMRTRSQINKYI